jgi:3-deoxy-D-manno-octulosonic-acid transferase
MRILYSIALIIGTPFILLHFSIRGMKDRAYLKGWKQRFALGGVSTKPGGIVIHAASVGEVNAAAPLIRSLLESSTGLPLTVTTFTPTGSQRLRSLFGDRVHHSFAPLDLPWVVNRFFGRTRPSLLVIMETEIWPNLFHAAKKRNISLLIANARLSAKSIKSYSYIKGLIREALDGVDHVAAQSEKDAQRFIDCGARPGRIHTPGNLKFDMTMADGLADRARLLRAEWGPDRPVIIAASTHIDDDVVFDAFRNMLKERPDCLLIIVPRHPERFSESKKTATDAGLRTELFSDGPACSAQAQCFVIDAMGKLPSYYACSDIAVIGGSFGSVGGHNALEASALSVPVIVGPNTANFAEITDSLIEAGAAIRVESAGQLAEQVLLLIKHPEKAKTMGQAGFQLVENGKGALEHTLDTVRLLLEQHQAD